MITSEEIQRFIEVHNRRNLDYRDKLIERGIWLDDPRSVELHFWADEQTGAALLAKALYQSGFLILMLAPSDQDDGNVRWSIQTGIKVPISRILSQEFTETMVRLAAEYSAEFDGWGASF